MIKLFEGFGPVSKEEWLKKATADLKGKNPIETFSTEFSENVVTTLYYDHSDRLQNQADSVVPLQQQRPYDPWYNTVPVYVYNEKEANTLALHALQNGANGLHFVSRKKKINLAPLLKDINLEYCHAVFEGFEEKAIVAFQENYASGKDHSAPGIAILNRNLRPSNQDFAPVAHFKNICLPLTNTEPESIPASLGRLLSYFTDRAYRLEPGKIQEAYASLVFFNKCQDHYFYEIAKIRAIRVLFAELAAYLEVPDPKIFIHSETTLTDEPLENLLINTTQAMAAVTGGTDALTVRTHIPEEQLEETPGKREFATRIARNVSNLLKEESHLDKVQDPAAGSYFITRLTEEIVAAAWKRFLETEELGGYYQRSERLA